MAFVSLNEDQSSVVAVYASPQNDPPPAGYTEIPEDDPRIAAFYNVVEGG